MNVSFFELLFLLGCLQGAIMAGLLWTSRKGNPQANRLLAVLMALMASACLAVGIPVANQWVGWFLDLVPLVVAMPFGPIIYFYTRSLLEPDFRMGRREKLHFLPVVLDCGSKIMGWIFLAGLLLGVFRQEDGPAWGHVMDQYNTYVDIPHWISISVYLWLSHRLLMRHAAAGNAGKEAAYRWLATLHRAMLGFQGIYLLFLIPYLTPTLQGALLDIAGYAPMYVPLVTIIYWIGLKGYLYAQRIPVLVLHPHRPARKVCGRSVGCRGKPVRAEVPALVYANTGKLLMKNPVNQQLLSIEKKRRQQPWQLEILKDVPAAKLTISSFGGKSGPDFQKRFGRFLEESFRELKKKNVPNLVIDLLNNGGGYDAGGVALFSYLIRKPTRYYGRQHTVTDGSSTYLRFADVSAEDIANEKKGMVREEDGTYTLKRDFDQGVTPNPNGYTGKVYFLVNGLSGSTTAEFTAVAHYNKLGTFIGEETGGAYCGGNGSSFIRLTLPHSKIYVNIPLVYYQMAVERDCAAGRGTMPDYPITLKPSYFYDFKNPVSEVVKDLIKGQAVKQD